MAKRRKQKRSRRSLPRRARSEYRQMVREADQVLARNDVEFRPDNWQQLALGWFPADSPERDELARYIADHEHKLGIPWARDMLRLETFFHAEDYLLIITHYDRAFSRYPHCALVEMWVADHVFRHAGDFWRARQMYLRAIDHIPVHPKSYYELGFMSYLLGDFAGALNWFDQAVDRLADDDFDMGARVFYNRGMTRFLVAGDRKAAIADVKEALRRKPDYPQAKEALRGLRGTMRWVPW